MNNGRDDYIYKVTVTFTFYPLDRKMEPTKKIIIDKYHAFPKVSELANFIKNEGIKAKCLKDCYYDEIKNRICLTVADVVYKFKLLNNLKRVLGFTQDSFTCTDEKTFCAENEPQLMYELRTCLYMRVFSNL